ncbi:Endonuclease/exonuclease/phosphatase [Limtongia smithiae]|uniref:Endonuclease/exonuclease/phosphatase n=1 Tax=Limtongia smithiae TaxID=1125753 RepID=UPI0034CD6853
MFSSLIICGLAALELVAAASTKKTSSTTYADVIRVQSWNLRYDSMSDSIYYPQTASGLNATVPYTSEVSWYSSYTEKAWSTRRIGVASTIQFMNPGVLCMQEALNRQVVDLAGMMPEYKWIGVGRDDGNTSGEYSTIFYRPELVTLHSWDYFWLSPTYTVPSKYTGAGSIRIATVGRFTSANGTKFSAICTHWDDQSEDARQYAASMIRYRGAYETKKWGEVLLFGDFNSPSSGSDDGGYNIITGAEDMVSVNATFLAEYKSSLSDTFVMEDLLKYTPPQNRSGNHATFQGFVKVTDTSDLKRIDFIMGGSNSTITPLRYRVEEMFFDNGYHQSDHRPVIADVQLGTYKVSKSK